MNLSYDEIIGKLRKGIVRAVFVTRDGRNREIFATRNSQLMAKLGAVSNSDYSTDVIEKEKETLIINVYDIQKLDFRKINLNTLLEFGTYDGKVPPLEENISAIPLESTSTVKVSREEMQDNLMKKLGKDSLDRLKLTLKDESEHIFTVEDSNRKISDKNDISAKEIEEIFNI